MFVWLKDFRVKNYDDYIEKSRLYESFRRARFNNLLESNNREDDEFSESDEREDIFRKKCLEKLLSADEPNTIVNIDETETEDCYIFYYAYNAWLNAIANSKDPFFLHDDEIEAYLCGKQPIEEAECLIRSGLYGKALEKAFTSGGVSFKDGVIRISEQAPETLLCAFRAIALSGRISLAVSFMETVDKRVNKNVNRDEAVDAFVLSKEYIQCVAYAKAFFSAIENGPFSSDGIILLLKKLAEFDDYKIPIQTVVDDYSGLSKYMIVRSPGSYDFYFNNEEFI